MTDEVELWDDGLTGRQRAFVLKYCADDYCYLNGRLSYAEAYTKKRKDGTEERPSDKVADSHSQKLLAMPKIRRAMRMLLDSDQENADLVNAHRLLSDLVLLATYNPGDILKDDGTLKKPLDELGDLAKCVEGVEQTQNGIRVKLASRSKAQEKLLRYYGLTGLREMKRQEEGNAPDDQWMWGVPHEEESEWQGQILT